MQAEQIEELIASAVPGGLKGSLHSLARADGYEGKLLWACVFTEAEIKEARKAPYPMARAYLFWLETWDDSQVSRPFLEAYYGSGTGWRIEGNAPCVLQLLQEAESLRAQVSAQAAEIERLKAKSSEYDLEELATLIDDLAELEKDATPGELRFEVYREPMGESGDTDESYGIETSDPSHRGAICWSDKDATDLELFCLLRNQGLPVLRGLQAEIPRLLALLAADDEADMLAAAEAQRRLDDPTDGVVARHLGVQDA